MLFSVLLPLVQMASVSAATAMLVPDSDSIANWPTTGGTSDGSCSGGTHCDFVDEGSTPDTSDYIATGTAGGGGETDQYTMTTASSIDTATAIDVYVYAQSATNANGGTLDDLSVNVRINGVQLTASTCTPGFNSWANCTASYTGNWSQSDIDSLEVYVSRTVQGGGNPGDRDDDVQVAAVYADVTYTQSATFNQSSYRWFENADSSDAAFDGDGVYTNDVTSGNDAIYTSAKDSEYLYVAGYDGNNSNDWRVEKHKLTDGSFDSDFGNGGVLQINPTANDDRIEAMQVDGDYLYLFGTQSTNAGDKDWRIEKRNKHTGAICSTTANCADGVFDSDGFIMLDLSSNDTVYEMRIDGDYLYLAGGYVSSGLDWRLEKRNKQTGALCSSVSNCSEGAFDTDGVLTRSVSSNADELIDILINGNYAYLSGTDETTSSDKRLRLEKINKVSGATCSNTTDCPEGVFDGDGIYYYDPSTANDSPYYRTMRIVGDSLYYSVDVNANTESHLLKQNYTTGALCSNGTNCSEGAFDTDGIITLSYSGAAMAFTGLQVDSSYVYWAGHDRSVDGGFSRINIRKYDRADGSADTNFGTNGEVFSNPSASHDEVNDLEIDSSSMWVSGYDFSSGNAQWRIEKRKLSNGDLLSVSNASAIDVGNTLAAENTAATAPAEGTIFRLRMNMHVGTADASSATFKLQYAEQGADASCDTSFTNETYADVDSSTPISFADNTNGADGISLTTNANDPTHNTDTVTSQTYEESNNFSVSNTITNGDDGMWDFALTDNGAPADTTYCLRAVFSTGSTLNSYSVVPEVTTASPSVEQSGYRWFSNDNTADQTTFAKLWGGSSNENFSYSVAETSDGGYVITGETVSFGGGSSDIVLVKFNTNGVEQWSKTWGDTGDEYAQEVIATSDNGFIVVGDTTSFGSGNWDQLIVKFNSSGVEQWSKVWGGTGGETAFDVIEASDGSFIVAGDTNSYGAGSYDQTLVKYSSSGVEQWSKTWGGTGAESGIYVVETSDGGFAVAGYTDSYGAGGSDQTLVKYNSSGVEQWSKTWGDTGNETAVTVVETSDGGLVMGGYGASYGAGGDDQTLVKFNASGVEQWSKTWGGSNEDRGYALIETSDNGLVMAGRTTSYGAGSYDQTLIKFNSSGEVQWSKTWGDTGDDRAYGLIEASDGGLAVSGRSDSFGAGGFDLTLLKFDANGNIDSCSECASQSVSETDHSVWETDQTITEANQTLSETNVTITEADQTSSSTETNRSSAASSVGVGVSLAANNTAASLGSSGAQFRLRFNVHTSSGKAVETGTLLKLQFAEQGADASCDTSFTNETYSDVSPVSGVLRFYNNTNGADGIAVSSTANDPTHNSDTVIAQSYEEANNFNVSAPIPIGSDGMWDFALVDNSAPEDTTYCFRVVESDGTLLDTYSTIPEITTYTTPNAAPAAPTLSAPSDTATDISTTPQFQFKTTDADGDYLQYKIEVCDSSDCTSVVRTIDQTSSQSGWSGQDTQGGTAYVGASTLAGSTLASHTYQSPELSNSTQYWWRAYAIDPGGSNTWSSASGIYSFTTESAGPVNNDSNFSGGINIRGGTTIR